MFLRIPEQIAKQKPLTILRHLNRYLDLVGFILLAPAVTMLLLALQFGGDQFNWNSSQVIGLFCGSGLTFVVWLIWNVHKGEDALLPAHIIRRRTVWASGLNYTFMMSTLFGASYFIPIYFQAVKGVSAVISGVRMLPTILPQLVAAVSAGILGERFVNPICLVIHALTAVSVSKLGFVPPFAIFSATLVAVGSGLYSLFQPGTSTAEWAGFQVITGLGRGFGLQMVG